MSLRRAAHQRRAEAAVRDVGEGVRQFAKVVGATLAESEMSRSLTAARQLLWVGAGVRGVVGLG